MKLSAFNRAIRFRLTLLGALVKFTTQETMAYSFNNWGGLISTSIYTLTYMAFVSIIYSRVKTIAGYNYGEILFMTLIGQINFYALWMWSIPSIRKLIDTVKMGELDLILARPIPHIWYLSIQRIKLSAFAFEGIPALVFPLYLTVSNFHHQFTLLPILSGIFILICGQLLIHSLHFIISMLTVWTGEGAAVTKLVEEIWNFGETVPFEGFPLVLKSIGTTVLPVLLATAVSTSFMLSKNTNYLWLIPIFLLTVAFLYAKIKFWHFAMRHYSSASS